MFESYTYSKRAGDLSEKFSEYLTCTIAKKIDKNSQ